MQVGDDGKVEIIFKDAKLMLEVTPEINPDGSILLDIDVSNSAIGAVVPTATGDAVSIDEKSAQTMALVQDGQILQTLKAAPISFAQAGNDIILVLAVAIGA